MRVILTFMVFLMASVTFAGLALTVVLSVPSLNESGNAPLIGSIALGFLVAAPISYWIAGKLMAAANPQAPSGSKS